MSVIKVAQFNMRNIRGEKCLEVLAFGSNILGIDTPLSILDMGVWPSCKSYREKMHIGTAECVDMGASKLPIADYYYYYYQGTGSLSGAHSAHCL